MCDTIGRLLPTGGALFAKNSDRSPNEPQMLEYRTARDHAAGRLHCTYIEVAQVQRTHATLLSRPAWMWGAEMGVNEHGVCIGNEAVFTKGRYAQSGLTGMDLLRLGLERGATANGALDVIIALLEQHGQGGDCGYDHKFFYDNAFLIMDAQELYILETAGKNWAYKRMAHGSISNRLSIGADADAYGGPAGSAPYDFAGKHLEPVYSHFSGSAKRLCQTTGCLAAGPDASGMMAALRTHAHAAPPLTRPTVSSPCMHGGGLVGDHTTASLVVELAGDDNILAWATGSSTPCVSLFKPWRFGAAPVAPVFAAAASEAETYWRKREAFHRAAVGHVLPPAYYAERDALEKAWLAAARGNAAVLDALTARAALEEAAFYAKWETVLPAGAPSGKRHFLHYWEKKTQQLAVPARQAISCD